MSFRPSEELVLEELSEETVTAAIQARGFDIVGEEADFFAVVKWKKSASSNPTLFQHIDGPNDYLQRRDSPTSKFASRLHLTVEFYELSLIHI